MAISSPTETCDLDSLKTKLLILGLDPEIKTNHELLEAFKHQYGEPVEKYLSDQHPHLKELPFALIDHQTLNWAVDAIWSEKNKNAAYFPLLIDIENDESMNETIAFLIENIFTKTTKTIVILDSEASVEYFIEYSKKHIVSIINIHYKTFSEEVRTNLVKQYIRYFIENKNYKVGFSGILANNPVVNLSGHGFASLNGIIIGNELITAIGLVEKLIDLKLPMDANIILDVCFAGCAVSKLKYTMNEIKLFFKLGYLDEFVGLKEKSFMGIFSNELFSQLPNFNGKVKGYLGEVFAIPLVHVLKKDGTLMVLGNATKVYGSDGTVKLKKEETMISFSPKRDKTPIHIFKISDIF